MEFDAAIRSFLGGYFNSEYYPNCGAKMDKEFKFHCGSSGEYYLMQALGDVRRQRLDARPEWRGRCPK